ARKTGDANGSQTDDGAVEADRHNSALRDETVESAESAARTWAGQEVERRQAELERVTGEAIDVQLESLRLSHERMITRVEAQLFEAESQGQERLVRMRRGQLENMRRRYEDKRRELEAKRGVEVGHRLVAAGVLEVA